MLSTVKAVVQGETIHWQESVDDLLPKSGPVEVLVTILRGANGATAEEKGKRRLAAIQKLATVGALSQIEDPMRWQRETRAERDLPDRGS